MTDDDIAKLKKLLAGGERFAWVPDDTTPFAELSHVGVPDLFLLAPLCRDKAGA